MSDLPRRIPLPQRAVKRIRKLEQDVVALEHDRDKLANQNTALESELAEAEKLRSELGRIIGDNDQVIAEQAREIADLRWRVDHLTAKAARADLLADECARLRRINERLESRDGYGYINGRKDVYLEPPGIHGEPAHIVNPKPDAA